MAKSGLFAGLSSEKDIQAFWDRGFIVDYKTWGYIPSLIFPRLRIVGAALGNGIELFYTWAASILFWDLSRSLLDGLTPWTGEDRVLSKIHIAIMPIASYVTFGIVCLLPLYWLMKRLYETVVFRAAFIILVFASLFGWHPTIINVFFNFAALFADWPRSYYLYSGITLDYADITAIGVTAIIIIYLFGQIQTRVKSVLLMTLAVLTMEHLGFVLVVGLFLTHLFSDAAPSAQERLIKATAESFVAGCVFAGLCAVIVLILYFVAQLEGQTDYAEMGLSGSEDLLSSHWVVNNFDWIRSITANIITMTFIPLAMGSLLGIIAAWTSGGIEREKLTVLKSQAISGVSVIVGLYGVVVVGMFFTPYPSDMGREFIGLSLAASIAGAKGAEFLYHLAKFRS